MPPGTVLNRLQGQHLGRHYLWQAAGGGGIHHWLTAGVQGPMPGIAGSGLCCFHLPLMAAIQTGDLTWDQAGNLIVDQMTAGFTGQFPVSWAPNGIQRYYFGSFLCIPIRTLQHYFWGAPNPRAGDLVFFSAPNLPWFAHVAVATGNGSETISFGHGAGLLGGALLPVERRTIRQLIGDFNNQITQVHFGTPPW